jgi:hypothetical protein
MSIIGAKGMLAVGGWDEWNFTAPVC